MERIYNSGIRQIAALHRGLSSYDEKKYRNAPMWQLAIELKSKMPHLPMLCDPSHIGGTRDLIYPVSQKAIDLNYDGLMIETHIDPDNAWSDAKQQVTPKRLAEILNEVKVRANSSDDAEFNSHLTDLRDKIDRVDKELIGVLATRMEYVEAIGEYKRDNNVTVFQANRWIDIFQSRPDWAGQIGLNKEFTEQLFKLVHDESIRQQTRVLNSEPA